MTSLADILIAEDSPTQAERLRGCLTSRGHSVRAAGNGREALRLIDERLPDLVITDVVMPEMDGYELCSRIKSSPELRDLPVILVTSLAQPEDVIRSLQCGADNFIRKPYDERYLLSRVANILTSRDLRRTGKLQVGLEIDLAGERHFINAERQQILDFLLSTYEDVSEASAELARRSAELELRNRELEAALRSLADETRRVQALASVNQALLDATAEGIALVPADGGEPVANAELQCMVDRIPALSLEASMEENWHRALELVADRDDVLRFADALREDPDLRGDIDIELPDVGMSLRVFSAPVRDETGRRLGRILTFRDVTREREVERLKSELVATVSHELRTPLASVLGFAELLHTRDVDAETRSKYVGTIASEARRLATLADEFLDLYRIEHGHFTVRAEPVDLRDVVLRQTEMFSAQSANHQVVAEVPDEPLVVSGEEDRLGQVLANLLSNAIKYSPDGGRVDVSAERHGSEVEVRVRDRGLGIPVDQQDKIFGKFFRIDTSETRSIGGTGLGLALCREIVEAHGGAIDLEDSAPGHGSTFRMRLPAASADESVAMPARGDGAISDE